MSVTWNTSDVPAVDAGELLIAARMWLSERSRGPIALAAVAGREVNAVQTLERRIADAYGHETARSLAVILRLRCLLAAFVCRRFEAHVKGGDETWLIAAAAAAAGMRVNADIGFSPVRFAWAIAAEERAMTVAEPVAAAAA